MPVDPAPRESDPSDSTPIYRERLWPSLWVFGFAALVIPAAFLVFLPINPTAGVIVAVVLFGGCVALLILGSPVIAITPTAVIAGRARLPIAFAGDSSAHEGEDATLERGRRMDARAWLLIRGWVSPVVRIAVDDPADPTPYWLISTRHPARVLDALDHAKGTEARGTAI